MTSASLSTRPPSCWAGAGASSLNTERFQRAGARGARPVGQQAGGVPAVRRHLPGPRRERPPAPPPASRRDPTCDIRIVNKEISRKHAEVYVDDETGAVFILSMGREPVRVNGTPVTTAQELFTGDHIEVRRRRAREGGRKLARRAKCMPTPQCCAAPARAQARAQTALHAAAKTQVLLEGRSREFVFEGNDDTVEVAGRQPLGQLTNSGRAPAQNGGCPGGKRLRCAPGRLHAAAWLPSGEGYVRGLLPRSIPHRLLLLQWRLPSSLRLRASRARRPHRRRRRPRAARPAARRPRRRPRPCPAPRRLPRQPPRACPRRCKMPSRYALALTLLLQPRVPARHCSAAAGWPGSAGCLCAAGAELAAIMGLSRKRPARMLWRRRASS